MSSDKGVRYFTYTLKNLQKENTGTGATGGGMLLNKFLTVVV